jgi:hypothetical protein
MYAFGKKAKVSVKKVTDFILNSLVFIDCHFLGEWAANSVGTNFTPHVITVNAGEVCLTKERQMLTSFGLC